MVTLTSKMVFTLTNNAGESMSLSENDLQDLEKLIPSLRAASMGVRFDPDMDALIDIIWDPNKSHNQFIDAIKYVRQKLSRYSVSLKEAKEFVEHMMACSHTRAFRTVLPAGDVFHELKQKLLMYNEWRAQVRRLNSSNG